MMLFPESPIIISRIIASMNGCNPPNSFYNERGFTIGWKSPNQGLRFWNRLFPDLYGRVEATDLSREAKIEIGNTVKTIQQIFEAPFVNKCQPLSGHILALVEALPEVLFVRIKREPVFIAQSILNGTRELWNDDSRWFSTKPRNYKEIQNVSNLERICEQVFYIEKDIDSDIEVIGKEKALTVSYEKLCKSPGEVLDNINEFYMKRTKHHALEMRNKIPPFFRCSNNIKVSTKEFKVIEDKFLRLKKFNGAK